MNPAFALRLALALPETPDNFRVLRELVQTLQNIVNDLEKAED